MSSKAQLQAWGKANIPDWFGVHTADKLPEPSTAPTNCSFVLSYGSAAAAPMHGGSVLHWIAVVKRGAECLYIDPIGNPPDSDAPLLHIKSPGFKRYLRQMCPAGVRWPRAHLEPHGGGACGHWSLYCCQAGGGPGAEPGAFKWMSHNIQHNQQLIRQRVLLDASL